MAFCKFIIYLVSVMSFTWCCAEPLFQKRAAIVQGKEEAPDSLGQEAEEEQEKEAGTQTRLFATL